MPAATRRIAAATITTTAILATMLAGDATSNHSRELTHHAVSSTTSRESTSKSWKPSADPTRVAERRGRPAASGRAGVVPTSPRALEPADTAAPSPVRTVPAPARAADSSTAPSVAPTPGDRAGAPTTVGNPFAGAKLYVDPASNAAREAARLRTADPAGAAAFDKIAGVAQADWFGDWNPTSTLATTVFARVSKITQAGALPVLVAYNIPQRDCNGYSGGGAASPQAYRDWIGELAAGIGARKAVVILEPDALPMLSCLSPADQQRRLSLLREAVAILAAKAAVAVYLDAGHASWIPAATMAARLAAAGVAAARGFSLNVSNYGWTADQFSYGRKIASAVGWKSFVVDTSRNGLGPATGTPAWCNASGRALGARPGEPTHDRLVDSFLWVKPPGESDGSCRPGEPAAGTWWPAYARGLAERADW
jgi:endoglucanase